MSHIPPVAETWRRVWGDGKFFHGPTFQNFRKKLQFSRQKFLMTFFSHRPGFSDFPFLFQDFPLLKMSYMTLSSQQKHLSLLCSYFRAHPTTLLLKILGGRMHGPSPTSKFGGDRPPQSALGLRIPIFSSTCIHVHT